MRLPRAVVGSAIVVVAALVTVGASSAGSDRDRGGATGLAPVDEPNERFFATGGQFAVECDYSHSARVDPIVWPGRSGRSHRHDFFGASAVDADSTGAALVGSPTTCRQRADTAAYWAPSLLRQGRPVEPAGVTAYYRVAPGVDPADVVAYPLGLAAVAGDAGATGPQPTGVVGFGCGRGGPVSGRVPSCPETKPLELRVTFPDCWDGEHLDSDDHHSHLAYSGRDGCGGEHPVALPRLTLVVHYPMSGDASDVALSSGAPHTAHADFLNGWDEVALGREVESCLERSVVCTIPESARAGR
ncbi:MAG TPA: DUF1996 domain-containing protein [Acidimicrobiia bacterium]